MSNFDHWMRLNVGDFVADTLHLSAAQIGGYWLLLMHCFKHGFLPPDSATLARIARMPLRSWKRHSTVLLAFFRQEGGVLRHKRIDYEREQAERLSSPARASRDRARARDAGADRTSDTTATATQEGVRTPSTPRKESPLNLPASGETSVVSIASRKGNGHGA